MNLCYLSSHVPLFCPLEGLQVGKASLLLLLLSVCRYVKDKEMHETEKNGKREFFQAMNIKVTIEEHMLTQNSI